MFSGLSPEVIVWIVVAIVAVIILSIWILYRLFLCIRECLDDGIPVGKSLDSDAPADIHLQMKDDDNSTSKSATIRDSLMKSWKDIDEDKPQNEAYDSVQSKMLYPRKRYLDFDGREAHDNIIQDSLNKSYGSNKSTVRELRSFGSRKSTGFDITLNQTVEPIKGQKNGSFLEILSRLEKLDEESEEEKKERERRQRKKEGKAPKSLSSTGIEAESSDETASQTFIGKEFEVGPQLGRIKLGLIKVQDSDVTSIEL